METDAGLPDFGMLQPLSKILDVSIDDIVNTGNSSEDKIQMPKEIREDRKKVSHKEKIKYFFIKHKKVMNIIAIAIAILLSVMQLGYLLFLLPKNYYYIYESMFYIINIVIVILIVIILIPFYKKKSVLVPTIIIATTIIATQAAMLVQLEPEIVSFAPNSSAILVLKENSRTHEMTIYRNQKLCFVQKKEQFPYLVGQNIDTQWLASDICAVTYESLEDKKLHQYVATYGTRGMGIRLDNVARAIEGDWVLDDENEVGWNIIAKDGVIEVTNGSYTSRYEEKDIVQFGSIAIVLCKDGLPEWTLSLDDNCIIDDSDYIASGGTISLTAVTTGKPASKKFINTHRPDTSQTVSPDLTSREKGIEIINRMELIFNETPALRGYESVQDMVKVESSSMDPIAVARMIVEEDDYQDARNGVDQDVQIESIQVKAGDIYEFLVEIKTKQIFINASTQQSETTNFTRQYRIRKADVDAYLGAAIMFDVDGSVRLKAVLQDPVDTANNPDYHYQIKGVSQ